ncbi:MAG: DnaB-like helicase N-terminal domain-containing protein [Polyangiales bacterium]
MNPIWLKDRGWLQAIGGVSTLAEIVDATPAVAHLEAHARIVVDKARVRCGSEVACCARRRRWSWASRLPSR